VAGSEGRGGDLQALVEASAPWLGPPTIAVHGGVPGADLHRHHRAGIFSDEALHAAGRSILGQALAHSQGLGPAHGAALAVLARHCDISPENIVFGPPPALPPGPNTPLFSPYLVDFGHAQRFPSGTRLVAGDAGSIEWSSIRSARGGEPLPEDDLQALGWVLLHGSFGDLPWFKWLSRAYKDWDSRFTRDQMVRQAQQAKIQLLKEGWASFGSSKGKVPEDLHKFICACCPGGSLPELEDGVHHHGDTKVQEPASKTARAGLDYSALVELLGGSADMSQAAAEEQDLRQLTASLLPLMQ